MSLEYAAEKFGTAVAILATSVGRIQERLESAYLESIIRVERSDIPPDLLSDYDYIVTHCQWTDQSEPGPRPDDEEARTLANKIYDLSHSLDLELEEKQGRSL